MLADILEGAREQVVDEFEHRVEATEPFVIPTAGRHDRLNALVEDLIRTLRSAGVDNQAPVVSTTIDPTIAHSERNLLREYVIEQVQKRQIEASPTDLMVISEWVNSADLCRLRGEERQLRALLDGVNESAAVFAPDGRMLYVNRRAILLLNEATGVAPEAIVGKTPAELGVPDELGINRSPAEMLALARTGEPFEREIWGRLREHKFNLVYQSDGSVAAVTFVGQDIHDRKLAQKRLDLLSKLSVLVGTLDYDEVAEALAHVPIPQIADWCAVNVVQDRKIRRTFIAQRDPAKAPIRDALMRAVLNWDRHFLWQEMLSSGFQLLTEVSDELLHRVSMTEEQYRLLSQVGIRSLMVVPLVSRGQISGIITCAYTDESGRRYGRDDPALVEELAVHAAHTIENARLLNELRSSEARFRIALAGARTVVFEQDPALRYRYYYNPLLRFSLLGKTHDEAFQPDDAAALTKMKRQVVDTGVSVYREIDLTILGDERRHYREAVEPLRDHTGRITGLIGAATDITEQQRTQQQLTEALGFRERMMGILGHDLRNPLSALSVADAMLLRRKDLPADAREQALRIRRAADRMKEMIETLLDFTRARFLGKVPVEPVPSDLGEIAGGVVDEQRVAWPDHEIVLDLHGDLHGEWDPGRMAEVISNLVGNAIAYGEPGTPVHVSVDGDDADVTLKVSNEGPPIPSDLMPVLFEPFRRGVPEDKSPRGLGLGLYIVQQIVLAHGGTVDVESTATKGTTFTLHLPRGHASPRPPVHEPAPQHA
jgi:PAS domain S-box-containing protein